MSEGDGFCGSHARIPRIPGIAKYLPWRYTTRHLAASLQSGGGPAESARGPRGLSTEEWFRGNNQLLSL